MTPKFVLHRFETGTPLDPLYFVTRDEVLIALDFGDIEGRLSRLFNRRFDGKVTFTPATMSHPVRAALEAYLGGDLRALDTIAVDGGGTVSRSKSGPPYAPFRRARRGAMARLPQNSVHRTVRGR